MPCAFRKMLPVVTTERKEAENMICTIQQISKMLGGNTIFEDLTLEIKTGDKLGIVGRNGSGKTTLFKLIPASNSLIVELFILKKVLKSDIWLKSLYSIKRRPVTMC